VIADLLFQGLRAAINPSNEPPLVRLVHPCYSGSSQVLCELGQRDPSGGVHVLVMLVLDEFLVHGVGFDALRAVSAGGVRKCKVEEERDGHTSVKATGRNHAGTVQRNLRYVDRRSLQQQAFV